MNGKWKSKDEYPSKKRGGTRKIRDFTPQEICRHPEHNPPNMRFFEPGVYEHTCPGCGRTITFTVNPIFL